MKKYALSILDSFVPSLIVGQFGSGNVALLLLNGVLIAIGLALWS